MVIFEPLLICTFVPGLAPNKKRLLACDKQLGMVKDTKGVHRP